MTAARLEASRGAILVLDDEWIIAKDIQAVLRSAGYDVPAVATSVREFEALYRAVKPALVIVDIALGDGGDGIHAVAELSREQPASVLFVSAHADEATVARASSTSRAAGFVVKPFTEKQLVAAVEIALSTSRETEVIDARLSSLEATLSRIGAILSQSGIWVDAKGVQTTPRAMPELSSLSPREVEVLNTLIERRRVSLVAAELRISANTVRNHLKSIFVKLGVKSQDELFEKMTRRDR